MLPVQKIAPSSFFIIVFFCLRMAMQMTKDLFREITHMGNCPCKTSIQSREKPTQ